MIAWLLQTLFYRLKIPRPSLSELDVSECASPRHLVWRLISTSSARRVLLYQSPMREKYELKLKECGVVIVKAPKPRSWWHRLFMAKWLPMNTAEPLPIPQEPIQLVTHKDTSKRLDCVETVIHEGFRSAMLEKDAACSNYLSHVHHCFSLITLFRFVSP